MNAKIAAAISLGASSLALIGSISIANAANAADATTTDTSNHPAAQVKTISDTGFNAVSNVVSYGPEDFKPQTVNSPVTGDAGKPESEQKSGDDSLNEGQQKAKAQADEQIKELANKTSEANTASGETNNDANAVEQEIENAKTQAEAANKKVTETIENKKNAEEGIKKAEKDIEEAKQKKSIAEKEIESKAKAVEDAKRIKAEADAAKQNAEQVNKINSEKKRQTR